MCFSIQFPGINILYYYIYYIYLYFILSWIDMSVLDWCITSLFLEDSCETYFAIFITLKIKIGHTKLSNVKKNSNSENIEQNNCIIKIGYKLSLKSYYYQFSIKQWLVKTITKSMVIHQCLNVM